MPTDDERGDGRGGYVNYRRPDGPRCENCGAPVWQERAVCETCGYVDTEGIAT